MIHILSSFYICLSYISITSYSTIISNIIALSFSLIWWAELKSRDIKIYFILWCLDSNQFFWKCNTKDWGDSATGKVLAFRGVNLDSHPGLPYVPLSPQGGIPDWVASDVTPKQKIQKCNSEGPKK